MTVGTDPAQCSYTIQDLPVASESGALYTYTVAETAHAAPAAVLYLAISYVLISLFRKAEKRWLQHMKPSSTH